MKRTLTVVALSFVVLLAIVITRSLSAVVLFSNVSPQQQYRVEITQSRSFPFYERAVFLNAHRNGAAFVRHKLLYTGDVLDSEFRDLYPNPRFKSESIFELGNVDLGDGSQKESKGNLRISNATSKDIDYLLIETGWYKLVVLDIKAGTTADLSFHYGRGISCQGQFANSSERFSAAVGVDESADPAAGRQISLTVGVGSVTIESAQTGLQRARCCASDRPGPDHEWLY